MFSLSVPEVALLLLWAAGVVCAVAGTLSKRFTVRESIVAIAIAVFIPVIGAVGAIALYVIRRKSTHLTAAS